MFISISALITALLVSVEAKLHDYGACVRNRIITPIGGTPWSVSYNWDKTYQVMPEATRCACDYYRQRNTGTMQWDTCPDCVMEGDLCHSAEWHIGGDELNHYCTKFCGAPQSEGSNSD
ncbi:uncharacterized protein CTRU02_210463 [Colletotrichum truncatum]|uniref:Uncharacterized protein n=1 Tax=Colletotrichum truncatum TaxID=5467 RepID=A0ACC3YP40_COLTU|nr:uncharacterized protein CTRU02_13935 [Colletotrichum truncatum]KAF6782778.1 hypothetical protein CTRU02_13935 [Colletotrichum truncatum]